MLYKASYEGATLGVDDNTALAAAQKTVTVDDSAQSPVKSVVATPEKAPPEMPKRVAPENEQAPESEQADLAPESADATEPYEKYSPFTELATRSGCPHMSNAASLVGANSAFLQSDDFEASVSTDAYLFECDSPHTPVKCNGATSDDDDADDDDDVVPKLNHCYKC